MHAENISSRRQSSLTGPFLGGLRPSPALRIRFIDLNELFVQLLERGESSAERKKMFHCQDCQEIEGSVPRCVKAIQSDIPLHEDASRL